MAAARQGASDSHASSSAAPSLDDAALSGILTFLRDAERLKNTLRSGHTSVGRQESVAEHSWRLCLMALLLSDAVPGTDATRVLKLCVVHDLGEAIHGDIPAPEQSHDDDRSAQERRDLLTLVASLPTALAGEIVALWDEYETGETQSARLAKALDKLETILQHNQGENPADFDYRFNLAYGQRLTSFDPTVAEIRRRLDVETARNAAGDS